ncbi:methyl-accepting chemotaxis protein [Marinomonas sp. C2222]|uniref:Methyl-accepting chemotaxis protein n=1 Tax=Marinomonas sargassi TaxID=2984494 RepID=A0ABT2YSS4_9GAMM|nr:methyl-accepting chemotaxis protein [Marinomonas sargassi]MCV2402942.1 methyl-accepting chemotaxis protein [Marinomonas sargassi]
MNNLSVRIKILSLIALFSLAIVGVSVSSASSSKSTYSDLQSLFHKSLDLVHNLEKSRQLLLQQTVEFERGFFQVSIAKSLQGYGIEQVAESEEKFKGYTSELINSINNVKSTLASLPEHEGLDVLLTQINELEQQQEVFLKASLDTYSWWKKLKTLQANKARRLALATLDTISQQMEEITLAIDEYDLSVEKDQEDNLNRSIMTNYIAATILIVVGITLSLIIVNSICGPLAKAVLRAREIASGDLMQPLSDSQRKDEVGMLEVAMDKLVLQLRDILKDVTESSNSLTSSAVELNRITNESSQMVDSQQEETKLISEAVAEIQERADYVSNSTTDASKAAHDAEQASKLGTQAINNTIESIESLAGEISDSAEAMQELQNNTNDINSILGVILGIAEQTNLLALNAAIEAARAGEQGRGFAVVADEVRNLAQNTQEATQQIETMINSLQSGAANAVKAMNSSHERSMNTVTQVKEEAMSLQEISLSVSKITQMNDSVSATTTEQATFTANVTNNVSNIMEISTETTKSIHAISQATDQLTNLATQLSKKVRYFNV